MERLFSESQKRDCLSLLAPKHFKQNKPHKKQIKTLIPAIEQYPLLAQNCNLIDAWISPKRMSQKSLIQFIERTYEMKFKSQTKSLRKENRMKISAQNLQEFLFVTINSGQKQWRPKPEQFILNLLYSIQHYKVKLIGVQLFKQFLTGQLSIDEFLFFMMSRSLIEKILGFRTVTQTRIEDLHQKKLSHKQAIKLAKMVYQDSGIGTADKLSQALVLKKNQTQITLYALLHYLVTVFKQQGKKITISHQTHLANDLQKNLLRCLQKKLSTLVDKVSGDLGSVDKQRFKNNLVPYCLTLIQSITNQSQSWFEQVGQSVQCRNLIQKLQRRYKNLLNNGWVQGDAQQLSHEMLLLQQWSSILSTQFTKLQQQQSLQDQSFQQGINQNNLIVQSYQNINKVINVLRKRYPSIINMKVCQQLTKTLSYLSLLKTGDQQRILKQSNIINQQGFDMIKIKLIGNLDCTQDQVIEKIDALKKSQLQVLSCRATLRQYQHVISSLKQQLDVLLQEKSKSPFSSPGSINKSHKQKQSPQLPMFGLLRNCEQQSLRHSKSFGEQYF